MDSLAFETMRLCSLSHDKEMNMASSLFGISRAFSYHAAPTTGSKDSSDFKHFKS